MISKNAITRMKRIIIRFIRLNSILYFVFKRNLRTKIFPTQFNPQKKKRGKIFRSCGVLLKVRKSPIKFPLKSPVKLMLK